MDKILWKPDNNQQTHFNHFIDLVNSKYELDLKTYDDLYDWSVNNIPQFWENTLDYSDIVYSGTYDRVIDNLKIKPGVKWFPGISLNFAENLLKYRDDKTAIISKIENHPQRKITYHQLFVEVEKLAAALRDLGVTRGDRVAGFLPNIPEAIIATLATASIGAIWSSSSPDFGIKSVTDRFSQIKPKIIFSASAYLYNGKSYSSIEKLQEIIKQLPTIQTVVIIDYLNTGPDLSKIPNSINYETLLSNDPDPIDFEQVAFDHPLYVLYTSGTTGLPKSIVHGTGGTLVQHKKEFLLHCDVDREDVVFYYTTCGWMMWNWLVSFLSTGATIVLYDGSPFHPDPKAMWDMIDELGITIFGTSAKFIDACKNNDLSPKTFSHLSTLRTILSTGSPLVDESFDYVYEHVKPSVQLGSISGGTDLISCFALASPVLPVYRGELQCRGLGMDVDAFDENGNSVRNKKGELVCKSPFPSMPVFFWNDDSGDKYRKAYFDKFPSVWAHGDFIEINDRGGLKIFGRSDATLNPGGVRIGTAEIYRVVEAFNEVGDSLVIGQEWKGDQRMILFLKLSDSYEINDDLIQKIKQSIRAACSPRHVPEIILPTEDIPYTISGKKVEIAVKKIIDGEDVVNRDALANPESLDLYISIPELA
jgi:acetoacetyl-CoA synthetase